MPDLSTMFSMPEQDPATQLRRRRMMADMLAQQATAPMQTQTGVPMSIAQGLAPVAAGLGSYMVGADADELKRKQAAAAAAAMGTSGMTAG